MGIIYNICFGSALGKFEKVEESEKEKEEDRLLSTSLSAQRDTASKNKKRTQENPIIFRRVMQTNKERKREDHTRNIFLHIGLQACYNR